MKQEGDVPIAEVLKAKSSISEVAERFNVSRPTLYKYMDFYDSGETERMPKGILEYFDLMSAENVTKDVSRLYLMMNASGKKEADSPKDADAEIRKMKAMMQRNNETLLKQRETQIARANANEEQRKRFFKWSHEELSSLCVPEPGRITVFFRGGLPEHDSVSVSVFLETSDGSTPVGRYVPEPGMSFVNITNLPVRPEYSYTVEQRQGTQVLVSEKHKLRI